MNKKILTIAALSTMLIGGARAVDIPWDKCVSNAKTIWVESVNVNGVSGLCVLKNACKLPSTIDFCDKTFRNIQVSSQEQAKSLIETYVKKQLGWSGCDWIAIDADNAVGQDYIGCYANGKYMAFEFDDTNERDARLSDDDFKRGTCLALGGTPSGQDGNIICNAMKKDVCEKLGGKATVGDSTCDMGAARVSDMERTLPAVLLLGPVAAAIVL